MEEKSDIAKAIDSDENFRSKKRVVLILSIILLALVFSGAEIKEANTFIFKIEFKHQGGLAWLLFIALIISVLRYTNYARQYKDHLYRLWSRRLLERSEFYSVNPYSDDIAGYEVELFPHDFEHFARVEQGGIYSNYVCRFPFRRYIDYEYGDYDYEKSELVSLHRHPKIYVHVLWLEYSERLNNLIGHREFLDVYSPYFLASSALLLFIMKDKLTLLL